MSRTRRQIISTVLGAFLLFLLYHYYANTKNNSPSKISISPISSAQDESTQNSNDQIQPQFLWRDLPARYPAAELRQVPAELPQELPNLQPAGSKASKLAQLKQRSRQLAVKETFERCWRSYQSLAWAADGLAPLSGNPTNEQGGWGAMLVGNLDTLWIMGMHEDFEKTVATVVQINFQATASPEINTHDVNIRLLGGLLSAYDLSADVRLLQKCIEVGDMLYSAFDTPNRMPIIHWDPHKAARQEEQLAEENVLAAEVGSYALEFIRLSQITGDSKYFDAIQRVMELFDRQQESTKLAGLWPVVINARAEQFDGDVFTLGAEANSLYKVLPRAYVLLGGQIPMYRRIYERYTFAAAGHNLFRPMNPDEKDVLLSGTVRVFMTQNGKARTHLESQVHYQSCFAGGMFALGGALFKIPAHKKIANKLVDGCIWAHEAMPLGIMPEAFDTVPCASQTHCPWNEWHWKQEAWKKANSLQPEPMPDLNIDTFLKDHRLPKGFICIPDATAKLRPDVIESMFILYRTTEREDLLDKAWIMFQALQNASRTENGNAAIVDVTVEGTQPILSDSMHNFWTSETLKYFYLMFSSADMISLDDYVFNAGGHPLKRPRVSWQRS
jgi:mannosyl-oligosaccharide alpha-1,2-mannosidase